MEVDREEYYKQYKDIIQVCNKDGVLLPQLLEHIPVPKEYQFTEKELKGLDGDDDKLINALIVRRKEDRDLIRGYNLSKPMDREKYEKARTVRDDEELQRFITKYPQFRKIIK